MFTQINLEKMQIINNSFIQLKISQDENLFHLSTQFLRSFRPLCDGHFSSISLIIVHSDDTSSYFLHFILCISLDFPLYLIVLAEHPQCLVTVFILHRRILIPHEQQMRLKFVQTDNVSSRIKNAIETFDVVVG